MEMQFGEGFLGFFREQSERERRVGESRQRSFEIHYACVTDELHQHHAMRAFV